MHTCSEAWPIHHRLEPIGNHVEGLFPRSTLCHPIQQRNLSQPESSITNKFPFKPHVCSFETRRRIASASFPSRAGQLFTAADHVPFAGSGLPPLVLRRFACQSGRHVKARGG